MAGFILGVSSTKEHKSPSADRPGSSNGGQNDVSNGFRNICNEAAKLADQLLERLGRLKLKDKKCTKMALGLRAAVESLV